jgi:UDP-N-acetylmuramoyl-tripeptide--D-alanyl-D-alanine ligase
VAEIARAKYELIESLPAGATAVLNADDEYVSQFGRDFRGKVMLYGLRLSADVRAENIEPRGAAGSAFDVVVDGRRERATLPLVGKHNIYNALAALAVGLDRGLSLAEAAGALATLSPADKRGAVVELGNITLINDCYNSNPTALDAMVDTLAAMPAKRRIVVAGEMLELGPAGEQLHRASGRHMAEKRIDILLGVRGLAQRMVEAAGEAGMRAEFVATPEDAGEWLTQETREGDVVLFKASRGVKLERALETVVGRQSSVVRKAKTADD